MAGLGSGRPDVASCRLGPARCDIGPAGDGAGAGGMSGVRRPGREGRGQRAGTARSGPGGAAPAPAANDSAASPAARAAMPLLLAHRKGDPGERGPARAFIPGSAAKVMGALGGNPDAIAHHAERQDGLCGQPGDVHGDPDPHRHEQGSQADPCPGVWRLRGGHRDGAEREDGVRRHCQPSCRFRSSVLSVDFPGSATYIRCHEDLPGAEA